MSICCTNKNDKYFGSYISGLPNYFVYCSDKSCSIIYFRVGRLFSIFLFATLFLLTYLRERANFCWICLPTKYSLFANSPLNLQNGSIWNELIIELYLFQIDENKMFFVLFILTDSRDSFMQFKISAEADVTSNVL